MNEKKIRSFIGFPLPENVLKSIENIQSRLKKRYPTARLVKKENLHLTLAFLGNIEQQQIASIKEIIEIERDFLPIETKMLSLIALPSPIRPRVVAVLLSDTQEKLRTIYKFCKEELYKRIGIRLEEREFLPHVTFARFKSLRERLELTQFEFKEIAFELSKLNLYKSTLTPEGAIYDVIHSVEI